MLTLLAISACVAVAVVVWGPWRAAPRERDLLPMLGGTWDPVQFEPGPARLPEWDSPPAPAPTAAARAPVAQPLLDVERQVAEPSPVRAAALARVA